ncbi:MAG: hypothetical protein PHD37_12595 [Gallionellaceae bacterium]|nr:hypothetical protein [Gallionellaceae bacterium]
MNPPFLMEASAREWRIRIGEIFDVDVARDCLRHCREDRKGLPKRLVFDLTQTRMLHTVGFGTMLYLKGRYRVTDGNAVILYADPEVGQLLRLAHLDRSFQLQAQGREPANRGETPCA